MTNIRVPKSLSDVPPINPNDPRILTSLHEAAHFVVGVRLALQAPIELRAFPSDIYISKEGQAGRVECQLNGALRAVVVSVGIAFEEYFRPNTPFANGDNHDLQEILPKLPTPEWGRDTILALARNMMVREWKIIEAVASVISPLSGRLGSRRAEQLVELVKRTHPGDLAQRHYAFNPPPVLTDCPHMRVTGAWPYGELIPI